MGDFDNLTFDIDNASSSGGGAIPAGEYPAVIITCEKKKSSNGNDMIWLEAEVTGDSYAGWILRKPFMLWSSNPEYKEWAENSFNQLLNAAGYSNDSPPSSASDLQQKNVTAVVGVEEAEPGSEYGDSNKILGFRKLEEDTSFPPKDPIPDFGVSDSEAKPKKPSL